MVLTSLLTPIVSSYHVGIGVQIHNGSDFSLVLCFGRVLYSQNFLLAHFRRFSLGYSVMAPSSTIGVLLIMAGSLAKEMWHVFESQNEVFILVT